MSTLDSTKPTKSWCEIAYVREPWVREKHGETIAPPNEQSSNMSLSDSEVMQPRTQPVGESMAFPISGINNIASESGSQKLSDS